VGKPLTATTRLVSELPARDPGAVRRNGGFMASQFIEWSVLAICSLGMVCLSGVAYGYWTEALLSIASQQSAQYRPARAG